MRLIDADKLKEDLQKHHDFFIDAWKENGVDKIEIPIPDKSRMDEITNCISMVVNATTIEPNFGVFKSICCEDCDKNARPQGEREFIEILAQNVPEDLCTYPEYKGKPYYSIHYKVNGEDFVGFGTYNPEVLSRYLRDYFMRGGADNDNE